jgi:hypothetical protein
MNLSIDMKRPLSDRIKQLSAGYDTTIESRDLFVMKNIPIMGSAYASLLRDSLIPLGKGVASRSKAMQLIGFTKGTSFAWNVATTSA